MATGQGNHLIHIIATDLDSQVTIGLVACMTSSWERAKVSVRTGMKSKSRLPFHRRDLRVPMPGSFPSIYLMRYSMTT